LVFFGYHPLFDRDQNHLEAAARRRGAGDPSIPPPFGPDFTKGPCGIKFENISFFLAK
jgi:hypothetical protein